MNALSVFCPYPQSDDPDDICAAPLKVFGTHGAIEDVEGDCPHAKAFADGELDVTLLEQAADEVARQAWDRD